ncbi:MAG: radical SAM protein [Gammaproteobacteria bacterium HGW-Gammaproteobacteria-1]|jgi:radical SAM/Cys-rich protein|nr:MAG: radical SAM protein [Gammaproteobacteria bacterium HGW-Gammaproteobacteria-1]
MLATLPLLEQVPFPAITRGTLDTLQVNLGYRCNQQCLHCHVNAGPQRKEVMDDATVDAVLAYLALGRVRTLDLTGGAPELHSRFRELVGAARAHGLRVIDRCNLTVLEETGQESTAEFLAAQRVEITASLPCYLEQNVDAQRGNGVFEKSIRGLQRLNELGYGHDADKPLNLVYNPQGPSLPPPQQGLEADYRAHLLGHFGIVFTGLYTLANMPIKRFGSTLLSRGQFNEYMALLQAAHQADNLGQVMCRNLVSVDWRGVLYDCDFNQMLDLPLARPDGVARPLTIAELAQHELAGHPIVVRGHCYGCTAGQGSSCGGALA